MAFTNRDLHKNSARDGGSSGRPSQGAKSMAAPTITTLDLGDVAERVDNGHRLALVEETLAPVSAPEQRREPLDPETVERVSDHFATARQEFITAMKRLDLDREQDGAADLHVRIDLMAIEVDDLLALLAERWAS